MRIRFVNGQVATATGVRRDVDIVVDGGVVHSLEPASGSAVDKHVDLEGGWLLPGFIDTQVNGGGGVLFNDAPDVATIRAIGAAHARFGTTAFLPTLISDTPDRIIAALDAVDDAIDAGVPGVVGVHIEGPFISVAKRGIHDPARIRPLDASMLAMLCAPRRGRVMLTLAPEACTADDIRQLVAHGVIVSIGHTNADYGQVTATIAAGATGFTHLFNAMSRLGHRAPGAVGAALDSDAAWCGLIVDNVHVHPAAVRIAIRAKGVHRIMLVSDAMSCVGTDQSFFMLQGRRIEVRDGICTYADGTLAGAALDMAMALRNTVATTGLGVAEAAVMASASPARFLGLSRSHGAIGVGMRADWAWLDDALAPRETWIGGEAAAQTARAPERLCEA